MLATTRAVGETVFAASSLLGSYRGPCSKNPQKRVVHQMREVNVSWKVAMVTLLTGWVMLDGLDMAIAFCAH